jgi:hypothetical protein
MNIIAVHQQGLVEQLDAEATELAGSLRDHCQRAVVLHHLYDHSLGGHVWALLEARRALLIDARLRDLRASVGRWGWAMRDSNAAQLAIEELAAALGQQQMDRMTSAYRAYRSSGTQALREEAKASLPPPLLDGLDQCHQARRSGVPMPADARLVLIGLCEKWAARNERQVQNAWDAIGETGIGRRAVALLGKPSLDRAWSRDERRPADRLERALLTEATLPIAFRRNPAQHFYALQHGLAAKRRQSWADAWDNMVSLAA